MRRRGAAGHALVEALIAQGVHTAFGVPGESFLAVLDGFHEHRERIRFIACRQEGGAAFMAEAQGKLTGRPGICFVTRGPGATNASIGVHTAFQDSTPLILFVGQVASDQRVSLSLSLSPLQDARRVGSSSGRGGRGHPAGRRCGGGGGIVDDTGEGRASPAHRACDLGVRPLERPERWRRGRQGAGLRVAAAAYDALPAPVWDQLEEQRRVGPGRHLPTTAARQRKGGAARRERGAAGGHGGTPGARRQPREVQQRVTAGKRGRRRRARSGGG